MFWPISLKERDHLKILVVDGNKMNIEWGGKIWTGLSWLRKTEIGKPLRGKIF